MCIRDSLTRFEGKNSIRIKVFQLWRIESEFTWPHRFHCFFLQNKYKEEGRRGLCESFYFQLPETLQSQFVKGVSALQSEVSTNPAAPLSLHPPRNGWMLLVNSYWLTLFWESER